MVFDTDTISRHFDSYLDFVKSSEAARVYGRVTEVIGILIESTGPDASVGDVCHIEQGGRLVCRAEVVGFRKDRTLLMPLGSIEGIRPGMAVAATGHPLSVQVGDGLLGRVLDGLGNPLDEKGPLRAAGTRTVFSSIPNPMTRKRIGEVFETGVRAIDGLVTVGKGQRLGIFAGSGVGKSVLLGMLARNCKSDVNVIALVGERGREVREFIERDLGEEGLRRSVLVVATSDQPALIRIKGALVAASIAEHFRDQGKDVLFLADSVTRLAMAQREVGLAIGEPPASKGYTPSVFAILPQFLERAGTSSVGTITGLFTVLVDGDDMEEPIADAVRSILDGHLVLSRQLAHRNHFPAIDILQSISRCMSDIASVEHKEAAGKIKDAMAAYKESEDLIQIGAYAVGSNERIDRAIKLYGPVNEFLRQQRDSSTTFAESLKKLEAIAK